MAHAVEDLIESCVADRILTRLSSREDALMSYTAYAPEDMLKSCVAGENEDDVVVFGRKKPFWKKSTVNIRKGMPRFGRKIFRQPRQGPLGSICEECNYGNGCNHGSRNEDRSSIHCCQQLCCN